MVIFIDNRLDEFIELLSETAKGKTLNTIDLLEKHGKNLGMPHSKKINKELFELRVKGGLEIRILYGIIKGRAYLVHGFVKKSNKTSKREIDTALKRLYNLK